MSTLYIVATPIGNLEYITLRASHTLKQVDFILCEDTRITKKLLAHYEIKTPCISYHQHSDLRKQEYILQLLKQGKNLVLVTDAGTPGISDPGNKLIRAICDSPLAICITPIPGPCALTAALSISGFPTDRFVFMGFPPHKKRRKEFFQRIAACENTIVFYESTHRIIKTLEELGAALQCHSEPPTGGEESLRVTLRDPSSPPKADSQDDKKEKHLVLCRELTKKFETVYRGTVNEVLEQLKSDTIKGEFVVIVEH